ncbi:MAG: ADP-ribosylation/crystallin J1 [Phycisphaerales bacterium]|nr:ADP-ribosylation/crystallin J1 [Hyphomonadaceae bacterium]
MRLWRPVGPAELALIEASGWKRFPPRLPEQPIFYPVLNFEYAEQIARDWNSKGIADRHEGHVVSFDVADAMATRYPARTAGAAMHRELWVPADELDTFNDAIETSIELVASYRHGSRVED